MRTFAIVLFLAVSMAVVYGSYEEQKIDKRFIGGLKKFLDHAKEKIEHVVKDVLKEAKKAVEAATHEAKKIFEKNIKGLPFDKVLKQLVGLIDSTVTQQGCNQLAHEAVGAVAQEVTGSKDIAGNVSPVVNKLCEAALHIAKLGADKVAHEI